MLVCHNLFLQQQNSLTELNIVQDITKIHPATKFVRKIYENFFLEIFDKMFLISQVVVVLD